METSLAALIAERCAEIERLRRRIEVLEAEIRGIDLARKTMPAFTAGEGDAPRVRLNPPSEPLDFPAQVPEVRRGGRQPGSITQASQTKLRDLHRRYGPAGFSEDEYLGVVRAHGDRGKPSDIARQLASLQSAGHIEDLGGGRRRVSERAVRRYGFEHVWHLPPPMTNGLGAVHDSASAPHEEPEGNQGPAGFEPADLRTDEGSEPENSPSDRSDATHTPATPG